MLSDPAAIGILRPMAFDGFRGVLAILLRLSPELSCIKDDKLAT